MPGKLQVHEIADLLHGPELHVQRKRVRNSSAGMSARAASTKTASSNSAASDTVATLMPNFFCASGRLIGATLEHGAERGSQRQHQRLEAHPQGFVAVRRDLRRPAARWT